MRHRKANVKLGRTASHRKAMLRNMATSLFEYETITTTLAKGKAVKPLIDKIITIAKRNDLCARRAVSAILTRGVIVKKVFDMAKDRFANRSCGYTIMVKTMPRYGDAAPMCILSLISLDTVKAGKVVSSRIADRSRRVTASKQKDAASKAKESSAPQAASDDASAPEVQGE
jgi:large subunit ribosomal protein L17